MAPRIIRDNETLRREFHRLRSGDIVVGRIRLRPGEEGLLLDLVSRGVRILPSATAQLCSRSKVLQVHLLSGFMGPDTRAIHDRHDLAAALSLYSATSRVICKLDRANAGTGILSFASIEDVHTQATLGHLPYPFVLQPFYAGCRDIRVVSLGRRADCYERINPGNFRHNLHCGGQPRPRPLDTDLRALCDRIMARAGFPYAHLDFLVHGQDYWLSEINLRGGLRGSTLNQRDYQEEVARVHDRILAKMTGSGELR